MSQDVMEGETDGYHLFITPGGVLQSQLQGTIQSLASEYGGPVFEPHITVLARIPDDDEDRLREKAAQLAATALSFQIQCEDIGMQEIYFRTLYITIKKSEALTRLHARANEVFGMRDEDGYMPHLSLLYGNYDTERKQETAEKIASTYQGTSFTATHIELWKTPGRAESWHKVAEFPFGT